MGFHDRFWTPTTARAILSWRLLVGAAAGVVAGFLVSPVVGVVVGLVVYAGSVLLAMPSGRPTAPTFDAFTIGEPWRHFVQRGQRSKRQLTETVRATPAGPLRDRLQGIVDRLDAGLAEGWLVAKRGDEIDRAIRGLDPTRLRSQLDALEGRSASSSAGDLDAAVASVRSQLDSADRLRQLSQRTADQLRVSQSRLDELVARATEISVGAGDTDRFSNEVDGLVLELESLHQALRELPG